MSDPKTVLEFDGTTGKTIERELTAIEIAEIESLQSELLELEAEAQAKADARASALAKLADLGLTQDEINAL